MKPRIDVFICYELILIIKEYKFSMFISFPNTPFWSFHEPNSKAPNTLNWFMKANCFRWIILTDPRPNYMEGDQLEVKIDRRETRRLNSMVRHILSYIENERLNISKYHDM